jgi:hypothetical protein
MIKKTAIVLIMLLTVFIFASCSEDESIENPGSASDALSVLDGITLKTELEYYAEGTERILAFWENNTEFEIMYGAGWQLQKYEAERDKWTDVNNRVYPEDVTVGFISIGYTLLPDWYTKQIFHITIYDENITEGRYRIKTDFSNESTRGSGTGNYEIYDITAEFMITSDQSFLQKSELDYSDFENSKGIQIQYAYRDHSNVFAKNTDFPVHVYKHKETYDTAIVINGDEYYEIAEGSGKWGVVVCHYYVTDEGRYLIYSYSRENDGEKQSFISVFDLIARKETYRSEAYETYDISLGHRMEEDHFAVAFMEHFEDDMGGSGSSLVLGDKGYDIGFLKYENGEFKFYENE